MWNPSIITPLVLLFSISLALAGCAGYAGSRLQPGVSGLVEIRSEMGEPAMRWRNDDGSEQLAYPRGPSDTRSYMVFVGTDGRLQKIENVLDMPHFGRIEAGKSDQAAVLRLLGPSVPQWRMLYEARQELVWEWPYCDDHSTLARFGVVFDAGTGLVRTTWQRQDLRGPDGIAPFCGR